MKLTLKAPGSGRLKLNCDEPLSFFSFKFNLRRYVLEKSPTSFGRLDDDVRPQVGWCRLPPSNPRSKRLELTAQSWNMMNRFQVLLSISTCAPTPGR